MISRRKFIASTAIAFPFVARGATKPAATLGLIADPQYADAPAVASRHYRQSIAKLGAAVEYFNGLELDFCVNCGDFIDRLWASFDEIGKPLEKSRHKFHHVLGNHDFELLDAFKPRVPAKLGMPARYYSVTRGGFCFVMLDTTDISVYAHPQNAPETAQGNQRLIEYAARRLPNAYPWNGAISEKQFTWLDETCKKAADNNQKVIAFAHHQIFPEHVHSAWNREEIIKFVTAHPNIVAWFNGHNHQGDFGTHEGVPYVTLKGMVETPDTNAFSVLKLFPDRLELTGHGREPSREILFRKV